MALALVTPWLRQTQKGRGDSCFAGKELVCWELLLSQLALTRGVAVTQSRVRFGGNQGWDCQGTGAALPQL